jgi:hypothetical protein
MNTKTISLVLGWGSAIVLSYFAFDLLTSLGDWARVWATEPKILIISLIVSVPAVCLVWLSIILVEQAKNTKSVLLRFLGMHVPAWAWLYIGAIFVALLRFQ